MNTYAVIILTALLVSYVVHLVADRLNLRAFTGTVPPEFSEQYPQDAFHKARRYHHARTRFGWVAGTSSLLVLLVFWFSGGFGWVDGWVRRFDLHPVLTGVLFIGVLMAARSLLTLPFSIYSTFVLEERFGFNKTTTRVFITDRLKGLLLGLLLGIPLLAAVLALFEFFGAEAWLYVWGAVTLFSLVLQFVAPTWIMPLFNTFTPLEEGALRKSIVEYARKVDFPLSGIFTIDGSRRSSKSNAFFTGFGKNRRIALFDTLVEKLSVQELVAVLAHEVGHYKKRHIPRFMIAGILQTGATLFLLSLFLRVPGLHEAFYMPEVTVYGGLLFFGLLYTPVEMVLSVATAAVSRKHEFEADAYAAHTTGNAGSMIGALKKLSVDHLAHLTPHPFYVFLNYSHPPVLQRIRALESAS